MVALPMVMISTTSLVAATVVVVVLPITLFVMLFLLPAMTTFRVTHDVVVPVGFKPIQLMFLIDK